MSLQNFQKMFWMYLDNPLKTKKFLFLELAELQLILAILSNDDSPVASNALNKNGFSVTKLATTGGFLRAGNTTLIIGCEDEKVEAAIDIIKEYSSKRTEIVPSTASYDIGRYASFPVEVTVGGATIFVLDVAQFLKV